MFRITEYKNNKIRLHLFDDLKRFNLNEIGSDHNIEFIAEENQDRGLNSLTNFIKASRIKNRSVKQILFSATTKYMITLTKNVGDEFNKNSLYQCKKISEICLKFKCDKHIFKIRKDRPIKDHYSFCNAIDKRMKNSQKFKHLKVVIKGDGF